MQNELIGFLYALLGQSCFSKLLLKDCRAFLGWPKGPEQGFDGYLHGVEVARS